MQFDKVSIGSLITRKRLKFKNYDKPSRVYAVTNSVGFALSADLHDFQIHSEDTSNYSVVEKNDFAYNPSRLNIGSIAYYQNDEAAIISPMYVVFKIDDKKVLPQYLYLCIKSRYVMNKIEGLKEEGARFRFDFERWNKIEIPLPPIKEQQRIVDILDKFEGMVENVEKELELRQKQYEYYREKVISTLEFSGLLSDYCTIVTAPYKLKTNEYLEEGSFRVIDQGKEQIAGYTNNEEFLLPNDKYVLYGDHTCIVKYFDGQFAQGADGLKILKAKDCDAKYLFYALTTFNINSNEYKRHWSDVKNIDIPVPSSETQQQIVAQLDKFESLIANLKRELELRKKQYEYYREKLLTFE